MCNFLKYFRLLSIVLFISSCGSPKYIYVQGETKVEYRDSTVYKDSVVYVPVEKVVEVVPVMDTLSMETSIAKAEAYVDTSLMQLRGKIENKSGKVYEIRYRDRTVIRDSIVYEPYPVEVEVERVVYKRHWYDKMSYFLSFILVVVIGIKIWRLYGKFKL